MVSSALAEQLKKLAAPQSNVYTNNDRKTTSLLFNPIDAANKDRNVFYDIGLSGLRELIALYEGFRIYEDTLFCLSSKDFERAVQSKEINQNLDRTIEKFLLQLSPYLMLESSHKALEWLVNRYHIHQYNQDAIMSLILPYHESMIFIRFLELMDIKSTSNRWNWLYPMQKTKIPLSKQVLYNQCVSNTATLQFIARITLKYVNEFGERADQLNIMIDFYLTAALGTIKTCKRVTESMLNVLLPTIIKALESSILTFRLAGFMILGELSKKTKIKEDTVNELINKIWTSEYDLPYDIMTLLLPLLFNSQSHIKNMAANILYNVSIDTITIIGEYLNKLAKQNCNILPFTLAFLSHVLSVIQSNGEEFRRFCQLPEIFLDLVDLNGQQPERVIKCVLDAFQTPKLPDVANNDESDIEIIDDNDMPEKILTWYSLLLKNLESKYPYAFDKVIKNEFSLKSRVSKKRNKHLTRVLRFKPAVARRIGDSYLFENLNHINPEVRIEAVKYISKEFESLKLENADFVRESIIARFNDDDFGVVAAVLTISIDSLNEILSEKDLTEIFSTIVSKKSHKWLPIIKGTIIKLCSLEKLPVNQETILALVPHLFPQDEETAEIAMHISFSPWGQKFTLTKNINNALSNTLDKPTVLREIVFKMLFENENENLSFDDLLDINRLNKDNILDTCFFMLLKSCSFKKAAIEDMQAILELLLETAEKGNFISNTETNTFSADMIPLFIHSSRKGKIVFEVMEYILCKIIDDMNVEEITKPWCDLSNSPSNILISRLFDVCSRGLLNFSSKDNHNELLVKLFAKLFSNDKEVFEFVANCACGHILYASNARDCISTEQQLISLDLLIKFIGAQENGDWMFESDVLVLLVMFNLNNPCLAIRQRTFKFINFLLREDPDKNLTYVQLLQEFINYKQEILLDHEQIMQVLNTILTKQTPRGKIFKRNCLLKFNEILLRDTPPHVTSKFLELLSEVNNAKTFSHIVLTLNKLEATLKNNENNSKFYFNLYESKLFINVCKRINSTTVSTFTNENIWKCIEWGLKEYRDCILDENFSLKSPCVLIMKQVNEEVFKVFPEAKSKDLVLLITAAGTFSNNPSIAAAASSIIRKINLNFTDFRPILDRMMSVEDPTANTPKKKKSSVPMLSSKLIETDEWKLGVTLLQCVQNKKKMIVDNTFVSLLFKLLNKCLRFEEQSYVEYTKQLILSSLWNYCNQFVDDKNMEQLNSLKSMFDIDLVVQCIRGMQNQQTHNHALILLSKAAYMLPEQVLHHTLEIFAFIGSSSLRHDDAYSFQIITKIIESIIPILVKLDKKKNIEDYDEKELQKLQNRVVPVLRTFADVVLHVPEHRRLPLYKRLLETLGPSKFLWVFLALLLETHITHFKVSQVKGIRNRLSRNLADQEAPISRLDFAQNMLLEFSPEICLESFIKLMSHLKSLPLQKDEDISDTDVDPTEIFSINGHTQNQLRHYKYIIITFINSCLSCSRFIEHTSQAKDVKTMENHYKTFIINVLTFIQSISKISEDKIVKYWRVMLHHSYDLLVHTNNLLSAPMFLSVIRGLLKHNLLTVRRKSMELLNSKMQSNPEMFNDVDEDLLHSLIPALLDIVKTIETQDDSIGIDGQQELEMNQQTALLSLKLLTRLLANDAPEVFKPVLEMVTEYTCNPNISGNVMASLVLCLAELCSNLKAHALVGLRKFMPALIKILKKQRKAETPELVLLSTVTALSSIIESLPLFLSPYLQKILYEYSILLVKWKKPDQESNIVIKLCNIKKKIASSIPSRILIPVANETHNLLLEKENFEAIGPVMSVLAESFANITTGDFNSLQQDLTGLFLSALQLRSNAVQLDVDPKIIDKAEDEVVNSLVSLVLKLSERSFRPFYFKIYDWAIRTNIEGHKDRAITFYRLSSAIASKLEGLFVLFAGHFIKNAAELLDSCNTSKTEQLYFDSEDKCLTLVNYIMKTLHMVFLHDSQNFLNKDRFETLLQPIVDQLENLLGGISGFKSRVSESVIPCISQFAVAIADDSLWKLLNYQILLKTRHNTAEIRLAAVDCLVATATQLGSSWLPLLAESVPFLSELLEDGDSTIETATKTAIRQLEQILEEPLEKCF